jgi:hypothetical protein
MYNSFKQQICESLKKASVILFSIVFLLTMFSKIGTAQSIFQHAYGGTNNDEAFSLYVASGNAYVMAGYSELCFQNTLCILVNQTYNNFMAGFFYNGIKL